MITPSDSLATTTNDNQVKPVSSGSSMSDFYSLFDEMVDTVYSYLLHRTRTPDVAFDLTIDTFLSLFKKKKYFWWKDISDLSQIIQCAENSCKSIEHWNEETSGQSYFMSLMQCLPFNEQADSSMRGQALLHTLHGLPQQQQKLSVLHFFLGLPHTALAAVLRKSDKEVQLAIHALHRILTERLTPHSAFSSIDLSQFLSSIRPVSITDDLRLSLRNSLFDRYQKLESNRLRIALPIAGIVLVSTTLASGSILAAYFLPSQSSTQYMKEFAAADILLYEKAASYERSLQSIENDLQSITAFHAEKRILQSSLEIAYYVAKERSDLTQKADAILDRLTPLKFLSLRMRNTSSSRLSLL